MPTNAKRGRGRNVAPVANVDPNTVAPAKPEAEAVAPVAPANPVAAKPDNAALRAINAAKSALFVAARTIIAALYSGASPVIHRGEITSPDAILSRIETPVQRIGKSGPTERDNSALAAFHAFHVIAGETGETILSVASRHGIDLGAVSRLASAGFVAIDRDPETPDYVSIRLAGDGIKRASAAFNRLNPDAIAAMREAYNAAYAKR